MSGLAVRAVAWGGAFCLCFCCCFHFVKWMDLKGETKGTVQYQRKCKPNIVHSHSLSDLVIMGVLVGLGESIVQKKNGVLVLLMQGTL